MIADNTQPMQKLMQKLIQWIAPHVWRNDKRIARKLEGFAATEAGSALDMLKAAELESDPHLRRLFFIHALDEARHAQMFRRTARKISSQRASSEYDLIHATRQNLFREYGLIQFVAFVFLAEKQGELQFLSLARHFKGNQDLSELFQSIGMDERFHVNYSHRILQKWESQGRRKEVRQALWKIRTSRVWGLWRRSGRQLGDLMSRGLLTLLYFSVIPVFAWIQRREAETSGWIVQSTPPASTEASMNRMY